MMRDYPITSQLLNTLFNVDHGFSEDVALQFFIETVHDSGLLEKLKDELCAAFEDPKFSWRSMLLNPRYEVFDAQTEGEARQYAKRILWDPLFEES